MSQVEASYSERENSFFLSFSLVRLRKAHPHWGGTLLYSVYQFKS